MRRRIQGRTTMSMGHVRHSKLATIKKQAVCMNSAPDPGFSAGKRTLLQPHQRQTRFEHIYQVLLFDSLSKEDT